MSEHINNETRPHSFDSELFQSIMEEHSPIVHVLKNFADEGTPSASRDATLPPRREPVAG